jgi:predicted AAA+ superfamily ATPase
VTTALKDTPVVMVNGPRQCGKTTMVREFASDLDSTTIQS